MIFVKNKEVVDIQSLPLHTTLDPVGMRRLERPTPTSRT